MKSTMRSIALIVAALVLAATAGCAKQAASGSSSDNSYPGGKAVQFIVPFAAGGTTDVMARALAPELEEELGSTVQVVNREGAGGQIGLTALAQAKNDGYTLGFTNIPSTIGTYLGAERAASYDRSSFAPISIISETQNYLAVRSGGKYTAFQQVIDAAKAQPKSVSIGIAGDDERLAIAGIEKATGAAFNLVPFDGGSDKTTALLGGKVDVIIGGGPTILPQVQAKKFTAIVVVGPDKDTFFPDVPTLGSLNIPVDLGGSLMVSAPKGTPDAVIETVSAAIQKVVETDAFKTAAKNNWQAAAFSGPADSAKAWESDEQSFKELQAAAGS